MASVSAQNRLRQARTSPTCAWTPRKSLAPVASTALSSSPARKSIFTARRVHPWNMNRGRKPDRGKKLLTLRSEEHTSELQSLAYLVCRLLLEKKKKKKKQEAEH